MRLLLQRAPPWARGPLWPSAAPASPGTSAPARCWLLPSQSSLRQGPWLPWEKGRGLGLEDRLWSESGTVDQEPGGGGASSRTREANAGAWTVSPSLQSAKQGKNPGSRTQACEEEGVPARDAGSQATEKAPERSGQTKTPGRIWRAQEGEVWRRDARGGPQQPARLTPRGPSGLSPDARLLARLGPGASTGSPPE